jgi:integrase
MPSTKRLVVVRFRGQRNLWEVDYRDTDGRRRREGFRSEEEAYEHATEVTRRLDLQEPVPEDRDILLRDFVERRWKPLEQGRVGARTFGGRTACLTRYVLPVLGHLRVRAIQRAHVIDLLARLQKRAKARQLKTANTPPAEALGPNTIRLAKDAVSIVLALAIDRGILKGPNPALQLGPYNRAKGHRKEPNPMNAVQLSAFLTAAQPTPVYGTFYAVIAKAGLRPSEARALKPGDIDWQTRTVRVNHSLNPDNTVKPTKTYETRDVELAPDLLAELRRHLAWLTRHAVAQGWGEPAWLFARPDNTPLDESLVRRTFRRALKRAGVRAFTCYDLRHTFASLLLSLGANPLYVSRQLGHKNVATTFKWYAKWIPGTGERWVDKLAAVAPLGTTPWNQTVKSGTPGSHAEPEVPALTSGGPSRTRTLDPLIKSQLLYQLS